MSLCFAKFGIWALTRRRSTTLRLRRPSSVPAVDSRTTSLSRPGKRMSSTTTSRTSLLHTAPISTTGRAARTLMSLRMGETLVVHNSQSTGVHNFPSRWPTLIALNGRFVHTGGTSASAPIFAAIITMANDARIAAGKKPVGWINPAVCVASPWVAVDD